MSDDLKVGIINGKIFYRINDTDTCCNCIGPPYSDEIANALIYRITKLRDENSLFTDLLKQARHSIYSLLEEVQGQPKFDTLIMEIDAVLAKHKGGDK